MTAAGLACLGLAGSTAAGSVFLLTGRGTARFAVAELRRMRAQLSGVEIARPVLPGSEGRRQSLEVMRQMPAFLDIVTLGLSAGLSFDASLELYCARYEGALSEAVAAAQQSWRIGAQSRQDALFELAQRFDLPALRRFAQTVAEALAFGTPLAEALTRQAQAIRDEQRAQTEEQIERAPVQMLIPLGTLIVPAMLLAIMGPLLAPALGVG